MNIKNMMKQAKKLQGEIEKKKEEINNKIFPGKYSFVELEINGKKEMLKLKIEKDRLEKEDIEILEDIIVVAFNQAAEKVDQELEKELGKYGQGMAGMF